MTEQIVDKIKELDEKINELEKRLRRVITIVFPVLDEVEMNIKKEPNSNYIYSLKFVINLPNIDVLELSKLKTIEKEVKEVFGEELDISIVFEAEVINDEFEEGIYDVNKNIKVIAKIRKMICIQNE